MAEMAGFKPANDDRRHHRKYGGSCFIAVANSTHFNCSVLGVYDSLSLSVQRGYP